MQDDATCICALLVILGVPRVADDCNVHSILRHESGYSTMAVKAVDTEYVEVVSKDRGQNLPAVPCGLGEIVPRDRQNKVQVSRVTESEQQGLHGGGCRLVDLKCNIGLRASSHITFLS